MKKLITLFFICSFFWTLSAQAQSVSCNTPSEKANCQKELDKIQAEIAETQKTLDGLLVQKNTLKGDVSILNAQIAKAQAEIKQRVLTVSSLTDQIKQKQANITALEARLENDRQILANLLKKKDQNEVEPIYYLLLSSDDLSDMITDVDDVQVINQNLQELFNELETTKDKTKKAKEDLDLKKNQELDAKYEMEQKKKVIDQNQAEKKQLLDLTAKAESNYQTVLADRQRKAEVIRSALFDLRDASGISFAKALEYANYASTKTGVRPAMILAILSQESDLGKNIGSCYVSNLITGDGVGKNTGSPFEQVMKAPRDTVPFEEITTSLGLTWSTTPVSCPLGAKYVFGRGFGGAMGPSQFIPSTWKLFASRIAAAVGVSKPNPWDPKHAITATALYMMDLGAAGGTYTSERNAACKYYSGRACDAKAPSNAFYGNQVIAKAEKFQADIDFLKNL